MTPAHEPLSPLKILNRTAGQKAPPELYPADPCLSGPVALLAWYPEARWPVGYASASVSQVFGYPAEEMMASALPYMSLIHPDDLERVSGAAVRHLNAGLESWAQRYRIIRADGQVRWLYDLRVVGRDELGAPRLLYGYVLDETERLECEQAFWRLAEASAEAIWIISADLKLIYANPAALRLTGYDRLGLQGLHWRDLIALREHPHLSALLAQLESGGSIQTALWLRRADQSEVLVDLRLQRLEGERLLAIGCIPTAPGRLDEPGQCRADGQGEIHRCGVDELAHSLIRAIPDLIWLKDPEGVYLACNARFESFFGAAESKIIGRTDYDFVAPDLAALFRHYDREALRTGRPVINEEQITFASDGHQELLETTKIPLRDPQGQLIGVLGIARNITGYRRLQDELSELRAIYQAILDQATDSIVLIHAETLRFLAFNDVACQTLGYTRDEFARLGIPDIQADLSPRRLAYWRDRINSAGWGDLETIHRHKNGELHPVAVTNRRVETRQGPCWVAIWRDLRERKGLESELTSYRERLETLVESHALELAGARLKAEVEEAFYKGLLVAFGQAVCQALGSAPEPNLSSAPQLAQPLGEDGDGQQRWALDGPSAGLREIAQALSELFGPKAEVQPRDQTFTARDCLGRVMRLLNSEAAARGIELVCASDPELPSQVRGDLTSLERLLFDLTAQVIAASAPGRISLRARLSGAGAKPSVRFEIQGDAIPEGAWPANPPPDPLAAVPLGIRAIRLAISKGLAERLGGELGADPLNRVIWVDLPLKTGDPLEG